MTPPPAPCSIERGILKLSLLMGLAIAASGCESKSSTSTGPSPIKCQVSVEAPADLLEPAGGKGAITVSAQPECSWTAASGAPWITGLTPSSGQGSGRIEFDAAANPAATVRQGHIAVNDQQVPLQQQPAVCRFDVSPAAPTIDAGGGTVTLAIATLAGCEWQASADAGWVSMTSTSGTGSGSLSVRVASNGGETRRAALLVAGRTVTLTQSSSRSPDAPPPHCLFSLDRSSENVSAEGGLITVAATGTGDCMWTATSQAAWITVVAGASGTGSGAVTFSVAPNSGLVRTGTLAIADRAFTVVQAAAGSNSTSCAYSLAPDHQSISAAGGAGAPIAISTSAGCAWTATSQASWITLTSAASGTGNGTVTFSVAANTAVARSGTLAIAGKSFTVDQASGCTYSINPTEQAIDEKGGSVVVAVSAGAGCGWAATSNDSWIVIAEGAAGNGTGTVRFEVGPVQGNGNRRTGTLTIAGLTFTVNQNKKND